MKKIITVALLVLAFSHQWCTLNAMKSAKEIQRDLVTAYRACGLSTRQAQHHINKIVTILKQHIDGSAIRNALDTGIPRLTKIEDAISKEAFFDARCSEFIRMQPGAISLKKAKLFIFSTLSEFLISVKPTFYFSSSGEASTETDVAYDSVDEADDEVASLSVLFDSQTNS